MYDVACFRALGVPVTEHSYEDGEILSEVINLGLTPSSTLVNLRLLFRTLEYVDSCYSDSMELVGWEGRVIWSSNDNKNNNNNHDDVYIDVIARVHSVHLMK